MKVVIMDSVCKSYGDSSILENVTLEIGEAERLVILGPSGCGKTTILRLIAGFIAPDTGSIAIKGEVVSKEGCILKPPQQRHLGMVFQDLVLWPHLSVKGNIAFGLKAKGIAKSERARRIRDMLERVGLSGYEDRKPAELSGGQQQRVALARALVLEPDVLLMDEPLSSLDTALNERLRKEIVALQETRGFTLVYVTHNHHEAFAIASRVVLMHEGAVAYEGTAAEARTLLDP